MPYSTGMPIDCKLHSEGGSPVNGMRFACICTVQAKISQLNRNVDQFSRRFTLTSRYMLSFGQVFSDLARGACNAKGTSEPR